MSDDADNAVIPEAAPVVSDVASKIRELRAEGAQKCTAIVKAALAEYGCKIEAVLAITRDGRIVVDRYVCVPEGA